MSKNSNEIQLDVIPIHKNEMYPTKKEIWHFRNENLNNISKDIVINYILNEIKNKFWDYDVVIVLEKGKVIEIIK
ncbi:MAG TPA: hypothetical protein IAB27_05300 [Candidatus Coprosoma intestinipullorum]|uniref:Uncharacterized protein n=1 Tax=Candidatus Coprosoma intestinipullorum TaxID=2840752 RepID=A0A9D0ZQY5_9FIRM|nr:hypothetical protein [Candidatus Coprosoma intestinipullorum]